MAENIWVNIMKIKNMVLVLTIGLNMVVKEQEKFIVVNGKMENNTVTVITKIPKVNGKKVLG